MFGLLKRFFSKSPSVELSPAPAAGLQPALPRPAATPAPPPPPAPAWPAASGVAKAGLEGVIALALPQILTSLPADLASLAATPGAGTFSLPVKTALAQLASGAVRIPFGELRQGSPPGTFYDNATQDKTLVTLPLPQILASLDPALLARRPGQKTVAVPESVTSVFGVGRKLQAPLVPVPASAPESPPKPPPPQPGASPFTRLPKPAPLSSLAAKAPVPGGPYLFAAGFARRRKRSAVRRPFPSLRIVAARRVAGHRRTSIGERHRRHAHDRRPAHESPGAWPENRPRRHPLGRIEPMAPAPAAGQIFGQPRSCAGIAFENRRSLVPGPAASRPRAEETGRHGGNSETIFQTSSAGRFRRAGRRDCLARRRPDRASRRQRAGRRFSACQGRLEWTPAGNLPEDLRARRRGGQRAGHERRIGRGRALAARR